MKSITLILLVAALVRAAPSLKPCGTKTALGTPDSFAVWSRQTDLKPYARRSIIARQDDGFGDDGFDGSDDSGDSGFDDDSDNAGDDSVDDSGDDDSGDDSDAVPDDNGTDDGSLDTIADDDSADDGADDDGSLDTSDGGSGGDDTTGDGLDSTDLGDWTDDGTDSGDDSTGTINGGTDTADDDTDSTDPNTNDNDGSDSTDSNAPSSDVTGASNSTDTSDTTGADESSDPAATSDDSANNSTTSAVPSATSSTATPSAAAAPPPNANAQCAAGATGPNAATFALIKSFESFVPSPQPDPIGLLTAGFGHKCQKANCAEVPFSFPLSQDTATQLLSNDAQKFVNCLHGFISKSVTLNDNQFGALTSFAFNLGCGTVQTSTLLKRLNNGEDPNTVAAAEIPRFNRAGGKVSSGLVRRRAAEVQLFQTPSSTTAHPLC